MTSKDQMVPPGVLSYVFLMKIQVVQIREKPAQKVLRNFLPRKAENEQ